jgi:ferredoxin
VVSAVRVAVDRDRCCASGQCVVLAPDAFEQSDDDGSAYPVRDEPPAVLWESVRDAAANCPTQAISIQQAISTQEATTMYATGEHDG